MIRNLKALGLALVAVCAMSAVASSTASASPALFTANVPAGVKAGVHGGQSGIDTFTVGALPPVTCTTVTYTGEAVTTGPSTTYVKLTPTIETCHIIAPLIGTRTMTITTNGCTYTVNVTKGTNSSATGPTPGIATPFSADLHITCPVNKQMEAHVYNTASHNDAGASTLCTYDIGPQTVLDQIELTNNTGAVPDDIVAHVHINTAVTNTILGGICGNSANVTAVYKGVHTATATNGAVSVSTTVS